jgi:hypothetical protein
MKRATFFQEVHERDALKLKANQFGKLLHDLAAELKDIKRAPITYGTIGELINVFNESYTKVFNKGCDRQTAEQFERFMDNLTPNLQMRLDVLKIQGELEIAKP